MVRRTKKTKKIILDTNFLMIPATLGVDIFREINRICQFNYEICILDKSIEELSKIIEKAKGKEKRAAKTALALIKKKNIKIIKTHEKKLDVDSILLKKAKKDAIIATQDIELKEGLKKIKAKHITLRQKKYLMLSE
ncbi:DNA-binding protein [Candidatus Woesearchaeota archaeon]|nr:MAG: DNA-binding protein [Candidatus Woesearchaeota archaeon]